jgi:hypothetical protein
MYTVCTGTKYWTVYGHVCVLSGYAFMLRNADSIVFFILKKVVGFCLNMFHMKDEDKAIYSYNRERCMKRLRKRTRSEERREERTITRWSSTNVTSCALEVSKKIIFLHSPEDTKHFITGYVTVTWTMLYTLCTNVTLAFFHTLKSVAKISVIIDKIRSWRRSQVHVYELQDKTLHVCTVRMSKD